MSALPGKNSFLIYFLLLFWCLLQTGCVQNESKKPGPGRQSAIATLLERELVYLDNQKNNLKITQRLSINGKVEEKRQEPETVKEALQVLKELDIDRLINNTSFQQTSQNLVNSQNKAVSEVNYVLKEGEKSPVKRITVYYKSAEKRPDDIIGLFILKRAENKLFSSRQTHYLRFQNQHLKHIEMNGIQKIIFSEPITFKSVIEING